MSKPNSWVAFAEYEKPDGDRYFQRAFILADDHNAAVDGFANIFMSRTLDASKGIALKGFYVALSSSLPRWEAVPNTSWKGQLHPRQDGGI